ncbi:hypothetical protein Hypma_004481 [Hypsizygus marmoreus]|uniref:F-box domain-containing protein n=1 Tax=Hypsizygus marmoreus TaxID=39966 RepID=A0A369K6E5_HYPMA|nr:hypothetical protein Hypma_004481 [Hypsizygus marmoreus]
MEGDLPFHEVEPSEWKEISTSRSILDPKFLWLRSRDEGTVEKKPEKTLNYTTAQLMKDERRKQSWEKRTRDLSCLLRQPPEIVFEVFGHVHPLDLYHLARSTKALRSLVMTRNSSWLWEVVFERNPAVPPCPPELSFPRWTDLLFGPMVCEKCNHNFGSLNATTRHKLLRDLDIMASPLFFLPSLSDTKQSCDWSRQDIQRVGLLLDAYEDVGNWFLGDSLNELKTNVRTRDVTASIIAIRTVWHQFEKEARASIDKEEEQRKDTVLLIVTRRLVKAGYSHDNVQRLYARYPQLWFFNQFHIDMKNPLRYIRRNWPALRGRIESSLIPIVEEVAKKERQVVVAARKVLIQDIYEEFNINTAFPSSREIFLYDPFFTVVNASTIAPHPDPVEVKAQIHQFIERWPPNTIDELVALLPTHNAHECRPDFTDLRLKFPSTVFTCLACPGEEHCLVGWNEMITHQVACSCRHPFQCRINERGCFAALALSELIRLDPYTHELQEFLTDPNRKFVCSACKDRGKPHSGIPLSWRESIQHLVDTDAIPGHSPSTWRQ